MPSYDIFFFGILFFLIGVLFGSLGFGFLIIVFVFLAMAVFLSFAFLKKRKITLSLSKGISASGRFYWLAGLVLIVLAGAVYYTWDDEKFKAGVNVKFDKKISFSGIVVSNPLEKDTHQEFKLKLNAPFSGNILVKTDLYPILSYGDKLKLEGEIKPPFSESYGRYLNKERISGSVSYAKIEKTGSGGGNGIKAALFSFKKRFVSAFSRVLPPKEAALLAGLTFGERGGFSEDFKQAMSLSGTTHLVALSGYNISIIVWTAMTVFLLLFSRRLSFILSSLLILGFVVMTGAEASVVRAAVMAGLALLASEVGRFYDLRNAIALAAFLMILVNPKILVFDIGFQLSFLALLGIVYLRPAVAKLFRLRNETGFLSWKEHLLTTTSAQIMVAPLLIVNFDSFSLTSLLANVIVLEFIPFTMALGFILGGLSFFSYLVSLVLGWITFVFLRFETAVIEIFSVLSVPVRFDLGIIAVLIYYLLIIGFIFRINRKKQNV